MGTISEAVFTEKLKQLKSLVFNLIKFQMIQNQFY